MSLTKALTIFGAFLLLWTFLPLTHARAETLPPGSYQETCRNYTVMGYLLRAQCKKQDGSWRDTRLFYTTGVRAIFRTKMENLNVNDKSMTTSEHSQNDFVKSLSFFRLF
jgi:hypothetical protein